MFQLQLLFCSIVMNGTALQLCRDTSLSQELHYCSQGSPTSTQNGKSWQMGSLQHHQRFEVRGTLCIQLKKERKKISERLISRKKEIRKTDKKKLMQPLSIEPVTSLDKCRVASIHQPIRNQEKEPIRTGVTSFTSAFQLYIY